MPDLAAPHVVLFDGVCNLCNAAVRFIVARDRRATFRFAALQSREAKMLLARAGIEAPTVEPDSVVLIEGDRAYTHSDAALRIARRLDGAWPALYASILVPRAIRDAVYRFVARHRYRWFGRTDVCMVPTAELAARFLESSAGDERRDDAP